MAQKIAFFTLLISFCGMVFLFLKKIQVLVNFQPKENESFLSKTKKKILAKFEQIKYFKTEFWESFFQKGLKKIRILSLKVDNFTFHLLKKMMKKNLEKEKKEDFRLEKSDDYFEKIKGPE